MKILITGGSGFIGSEVIVRLLQEGTPLEDLLFLARSRPRAGGLLDLRLKRAGLDSSSILKNLRLIETSFEDSDKFQKSLKQISELLLAEESSQKCRVLHLAAVISTAHSPQLQGLSEHEQAAIQNRVNVGVTSDLLQWSESFADCFVYTSSVVAFGGTLKPNVRSEKDFEFFPEESSGIAYFTTKRQAHEDILRQAKIPALIFCPAIVHGSFEHFKSSRGHLKLLREGRLHFAPPGGGSFVSLDLVARVIADSLKGAPPLKTQTRLLVEEHMSYADYFRKYVKLWRRHVGQMPPESRPSAVGSGRIFGVPSIVAGLLLGSLRGLPLSEKKKLQMHESIGQSRLFLYFKSEYPNPSSKGFDDSLEEHFNTLS